MTDPKPGQAPVRASNGLLFLPGGTKVLGRTVITGSAPLVSTAKNNEKRIADMLWATMETTQSVSCSYGASLEPEAEKAMGEFLQSKAQTGGGGGGKGASWTLTMDPDVEEDFKEFFAQGGTIEGSEGISPRSITEAKVIPEHMRSYMERHGPDSSVVVPRSVFSDCGNSEEGPAAFGLRPRQLVSRTITLDEEAALIQLFIELLARPITKKDQWYIASLPQHLANGMANPIWLLFRIGRCTGSMAGDVFKVNPYCSRFKRLKELLWKKFKGNIMTRWGNDHEDDAQHSFMSWMEARLLDEETDDEGYVLTDISIENFGLCVCRAFPPFAMSPDGILVEVWSKKKEVQPVEKQAPTVLEGRRANGPSTEWREDGLYNIKVKRILIEFKCPFRARNKTWYDNEDVYKMEKIKRHPPDADGNDLYLPVPSYYIAQCMYGMHVLGVMDNWLTTPEYTYMGVWHPAVHGEGFPDFWAAQNESGTATTVACNYGSVQITKIKYNAEYATNLIAEVRDFWYNEYAPALWRKLTGRLTEDQLEKSAETLEFSDEDLAPPDIPGLKLKRKAKEKKKKKKKVTTRVKGKAKVTTRVKRKRTLVPKKKSSKQEPKAETIEWDDEDEDSTFAFAHIESFKSAE